MDQSMIIVLMSLLALLISFYCFYLVNQLRKQPKTGKESFSSRPLQLQAYERVVMLAERISLPNLVSRANQPGLNVREMQLLFVEMRLGNMLSSGLALLLQNQFKLIH